MSSDPLMALCAASADAGGDHAVLLAVDNQCRNRDFGQQGRVVAHQKVIIGNQGNAGFLRGCEGSGGDIVGFDGPLVSAVKRQETP